MSATPAPNPALLAKAALKRLSETRQEPTPDNFRKAYNAECVAQGQPPHEAPAAPAQPAAPTAPDEGPQWAALLSKITRGLERSNRHWTAARKKESMQRVLDSSKSSGQKLLHRLSQLANSWDADTPDTTVELDTPSPEAAAVAVASTAHSLPAAPTIAPTTPSAASTPILDSSWALRAVADTLSSALPQADLQAAEAQSLLTHSIEEVLEGPLMEGPQATAIKQSLNEACSQAKRVIEHRLYLTDQLTGLCRALTDSLVDLAEEESWVAGQCTAMRAELDEGLSSRGTRRMHQLLEQTRLRQRELRQEREAARMALKQLIHQMLSEMAELGHATGRFQDKLISYADTIGQADSLESLTGVVREMVAESRTVHGVITQAQEKLQTEHARATELTDKVQRLEAEIRKLSEEVSTDPLTQIANRRGLMRAFEAERSRSGRQSSLLAVGLLDVDNFKKLNDTLGHQTGDEALKFLAKRVSESMRPTDIVARYGGEEFVVILPDTPVDEAQAIVTRLQRQLSAEFFTADENKVFITFSAGVTQYREGEAIELTLDRADMALYEAKRTGKNRTCLG
jgi:diguanylate cyclase